MTSVQSTSQSEEKIKLLNACHRGDLDYLGKFIVDGGNLRNMIDNQTGYTPLHYCVKWIEGKADCTKEDHNDNKVDDDANVFKQYDRLKCTRVIIKSNPEFLNYFDHNGFTPIHLAVINGDVDFLKVLSEFTNVNMKIKTKAKSLLLSTSSSSEPSEFSELNNTGRTVLHLCVIYTQIEVLTYFLTNINNIFKEMINEHDDQGATALHYSVQVNPEQIDQLFELLISIGGANLNSCDTHGRTPLIWAATVGSKHAVESLLKMGANLNHRDTHGLTALHCAASRGHLQTVQSILNWIYLANRDDESKVGVFRDVIDNDGCSPLFYSVATGHVKVTECLIKAGTNVMHVDHKGRTVCHCLARLSSLSNGIKSEKLIKTQLDDLMKAGLDPWKANNNAATPLHEACLLRNVYFIKQLANLPGFDEVVNAKESQGHSPLHLVVAASWSAEPSGIRLCQFLLEHGADVNSVTSLPNKEHVTPLNLAYLNETSDEKSKEALIDLLKHYGGRTYQELIDEGRVCADQDVDTINTVSNEAQFYDDHNNDKPDSSLVSDYVACPEKELKLINESQKLVLIKEEVETTVKTLPHKTDSATEPIAPPSLGLALKDSSVQTCSDNRRRRKKRLSTSSSTTISSEKLKQEPVSTVSCYTQTDRHFYKSSKDSTSGSSSPNNPVEDNEDNVFRNNDNSHHDKNSLQQLVVRMPTPSDLKVQNQNSSAADRIRTAIDSNNNKRLNRKVSNSKSLSNMQKQSNDPYAHLSKHNGRAASNSKCELPYSQIYLERELPLALKKYLEKENYNYFPLTGRSRMPKPTISPYLQPVVPGLLLNNHRQVNESGKRNIRQRNQNPDHTTQKHIKSAGFEWGNHPGHLNNCQTRSSSASTRKITDKKPIQSPSASTCSTVDSVTHGSHYTVDKSIKPRQARSQSSKNLHSYSNINENVQQSVADYEFYRLINQLLKQTSPVIHRKAKATATMTKTLPVASKSMKKSAKSKVKLTVYEYDDEHSAMGGELTPVGDRNSDTDMMGANRRFL